MSKTETSISGLSVGEDKFRNIDSTTHVRGASCYLDDIRELNGTLYGALFDSPIAHGTIRSLDLTDAISSPGVVRIFTSRDAVGDIACDGT